MKLWFDPRSGEFEYEASEEIFEAIKRFDSRLTGVTFFPTLLGIVTPNSTEKPFEQIFATSYNVDQIDFTDLFTAMGFQTKTRDGRNLSNFVPALLSAEDFVSKHSYLDVTFRTAKGFGLDVFLYVLWAVSNLALVPNSAFKPDVNYGFLFFTLLRRGYAIYQTDSFVDAVKDRLLIRKDIAQMKRDEIDRAIDAVLSHISLSEEGRKRISLWSGGPRPIVSRHVDSWLIDTVGIFEFIARMFVGIHDDGGIRGTIFEHTVRSAVKGIKSKAGLELGPRKIFDNGVLIDEVDIMVRRGRRVFVCECFSMWMPLNFEIGDPKTIETRTAQIDKKIDQATETCEYLTIHRRGSNYDYRDVEHFVPLVVSPFVEWLPGTSDRYWLFKRQPRVMSVDELVKFLSTAPSDSKRSPD